MKLSIWAILPVCMCILFCADARAQSSDWRTSFVPIDPWRAIDGQTNYVKLSGIQFCGKIVDITPHGVRIEGEWGPLGTLYYPVNGWGDNPDQPESPDYFVTNYPYKTTIGETIPSAERLMAWYAGTYTYNAANGSARTIGKLDYGTPCGPDPVLLAASQKRIQDEAEKRRASDLRKIEALERDATNGDSSAQYSLGFHYLHGIDCETNEVMGIYWLLQAQAQGNTGASNALQEFEFKSTNRPYGKMKR
ncbi:MAG TPA: SEL1-like repeat protein [Verrucomicrobiae bacterium]|jgi:hypothetical protein